jgi:hypothetical protein
VCVSKRDAWLGLLRRRRVSNRLARDGFIVVGLFGAAAR